LNFTAVKLQVPDDRDPFVCVKLISLKGKTFLFQIVWFL